MKTARLSGSLGLLPAICLVMPACDEAKQAIKSSPSPSERPAQDPALPASDKAARLPTPWDSREGCLKMLAASRPKQRRDAVRIASWNVRYFPDGSVDRADEPKTDVEWLACGMALLGADVVAVQEFKSHELAQRASGRLTTKLDEFTRGKWKLELDKCGGGNVPHVGVLYDSSKVRFDSIGDLDALRHSRAKECDPDLHPGYAAKLSFGRDLSLTLLVVHLQAGSKAGSYDKRRKAWEGMPAAIQALRKHGANDGLVVAGDFNTDGCEDCKPAVPSPGEVRQLSQRLAELEPSLKVLQPTLECTEYHDADPWLFDHFAVSPALQEKARGPVIVSGYCAERRCSKDADEFGDADEYLSDHCPIVLELAR